MPDLLVAFNEGGSWMYAVATAALGIPFATVALLACRAQEIRVPAGLWIAVPCLLFALGALGTLSGAGVVLEVVPLASPEIRGALAANGFQIASYPAAAGAAVAGLGSAILALAVGVSLLVWPQGPTRITPVPASGALFGSLLVIPLAQLLGFDVAVVTGIGALGLALAAVRTPADPHVAEGHVAGRLLAGGLAMGACAAMGLSSGVRRLARAYGVRSDFAQLEAQGWVEAALDGARVQQLTVASVVVFLFFATLLAAAPLAGALLHLRGAFATAFGGIVLAGSLLAGGAAGQRMAQVADRVMSFEQMLRIEIAEAGITLPTVPPDRVELLKAASVLQVTDRGATYRGEPVEPGFEGVRSEVIVEADQGVSLDRIATYVSRLGDARIYWAVEAGDLYTIEIAVHPTSPPGPSGPTGNVGEPMERAPATGLGLIPDPPGWQIIGQRERNRLVRTVPDPEGLSLAIAAVYEEYPETIDVAVWMPEGATVQDLVDVFASIQADDLDDPRWLTWRRDRAPTPRGMGSWGEPEAYRDDIHFGGGPLTRGQVREVVDRHDNQIRYCYQRALVRDPTLSLRVTVDFEISPDGIVTRAEGTSVPPHEEVVHCLVARIYRMQFPEPLGGGVVKVRFPWVFAPGHP